MDFKVTNLDGAYETLKSLNNLATTDGISGVTLASTLAGIINNLKAHWIGSDATLHINNLIKVYDALCALVTDVTTVAHNVSIPIVKAKEIREANGGAASDGTVIPVYDGSFEKISEVLTTEEYYVDPTAAPGDYRDLVGLSNDFNTFADKFAYYETELMENWTSGNDRATAESSFTEFNGYVVKYKEYLSDAKDNLKTATSNLSQL